MTTNSEIRALDGQQLGRAPLLSRADTGTLTNAVRTIRSLGDVPLAANLDALHSRLAATQAPALTPWHCAACGQSGATYSHRDACFAHAEGNRHCGHEPVDGPPVIHQLSDTLTDRLMRATEDTALAEQTFLTR